MKRKFKLFATVASLCLSVALMAFGVYAASTVTYTVNGTVSYTMDDVLVHVTAKLEYAQDTHQGFANSGAIDTALTGLGGKWTALEVADTDGEGPITAITGGMIGDYMSYDESTELPKVTDATDPQEAAAPVSFNTSSLWKITITVETINPDGVEVNLGSHTSFGVTGTNYAVYDATPSSDYGKLIEDKDGTGSTKSLTFTYYVYLINPTIAIAAESPFTIPLTITQYQA